MNWNMKGTDEQNLVTLLDADRIAKKLGQKLKSDFHIFGA